MIGLTTLTDDYLQQKVLQHGELLRNFPFLHAAKAAVDALGSCLKCQRKEKKLAAQTALNQAKQQLAEMGAEQQALFKQLAGIKNARVVYVVREGNQNRSRFRDF